MTASDRPARAIAIAKVPPEAPEPRPQFRFVDDVAILSLPTPEWLVHDFIVEGTIAEIFGSPGSFKSFLALDIAMSVATGQALYGRKVKQGPVIYVCGEGVAGMGPRVDAWKHRAEVTKRAGVQFVPGAVNLLHLDNVAAFVREVKALDIAPKLVILDTLARCIPGGDENRQLDMGVAVASLDLMRDRIPGNPCVLTIHHTPRSSDTSRGSNSLDGAVDTQVLVKREGNTVTVSCPKQKYAEEFAPFTLTRELVQESVVLVTAAQLDGGNRLIQGDPRFQLLRSLHDASLPHEWLTTSVWLKVSEMKARTFYDARKFLIANGYVDGAAKKRGAPNVITPHGIETLTANCNVTASLTAPQ